MQVSFHLIWLGNGYLAFLCRSWALSDTAFSRGEVGIQINGLIWMGDFDHMLSQIEKKRWKPDSVVSN